MNELRLNESRCFKRNQSYIRCIYYSDNHNDAVSFSFAGRNFLKKKKKGEKPNRVLSPRGRERARKGSVAAALIKHSTISGLSLDPVAVIIGRSEAPSRCPGEAKRERKETKALPPDL